MTASAGASRAFDDSAEPAAERSPAELFGLLDDEYAREILACLVEEPKSARAIGDACDCSRPTVYRRLERLCDAGLVASSMQYDADGHHRKVFRSRLAGVSVELTGDGWTVAVDAVGSD
ncbi:ArsR/SmtB family transcription factor [Haloarcula sediminis]|uniref:ArsR/SmtB family transcription factor n=1 Tax=Haloarcula sediminis TaxID=3111777 RepID=UPI002D771BB2|nr:helix-turn-helix domain-containing protein [Haloarcula sp. CK38]